MFESIQKAIVDAFEPIREFFLANYQNPFMWLGFFFLGLFIFNVVYRALQKES